MKNKKIIILVSTIFLLIISIFGITYALYRITKTSSNSKLVVGDIYMNYNEGNELILENAIPTNTYDATKYFEFTITGKNTSSKDINFEIKLVYGNDISNKIRLQDKFIRYRLTEMVNNKEQEIIGSSWSTDLTNQTIYNGIIPKNTTSEITKTYRMYLWVDASVNICGGDITDNCDYYIDKDELNWENIYHTIKVNVIGNFLTTSSATDEACFTTVEKRDYQVNSSMNSTQLNECTSYFSTYMFNSDETVDEYCAGTGTKRGTTFQDDLNDFLYSNDVLTELETKKIIKTVGTNKSITINNYDASCGDSVIIPQTINGYSVKEIGSSAFKSKGLVSVQIPNNILYIASYAFEDNQLTTIEIPNSIKIIREQAFYNNQLTSIVLPDSIETLEYNAFRSNQIESITFGKKIKTIYGGTFLDNPLSEVDIPDSVTILSCYAFDDYITINKSDDLVCNDTCDYTVCL